MAGVPPQPTAPPRSTPVATWMTGPTSGPSAPAAPPVSVAPPGQLLSSSGPLPPHMPGVSSTPQNFGGVPQVQFRPGASPQPGDQFVASGNQHFLPGTATHPGIAQPLVGLSSITPMPPQPLPFPPQVQHLPRPGQQPQPGQQSQQGQQPQPPSSQPVGFVHQARPLSISPFIPQQQSQPLGIPSLPVPGSSGLAPSASFTYGSSLGFSSLSNTFTISPPSFQIQQPHLIQPVSQSWPSSAGQSNGLSLPQVPKPPTALGVSSASMPAIPVAPTSMGSSDWQEHSAPDGRRYYYNKKTKQSSWEKPVELMTPTERADASTVWKEFKTADGRKYYYNKVTKQSKWTMPEEMKIAREQAAKPGNVSSGNSALSTESMTPLTPGNYLPSSSTVTGSTAAPAVSSPKLLEVSSTSVAAVNASVEQIMGTVTNSTPLSSTLVSSVVAPISRLFDVEINSPNMQD